MKTFPSNKNGFTLPEVVITAMLIVVMMVPISRTAYLTVLSTRYARDTGTAIAVGQQRLEKFSELSYDQISSGSETVDGFDLVWTVNTVSGRKIVNLTISWTIVAKTYSVDLNTVYVPESPGGFTL